MNVKELRIRQSITGLIAKTKPNTCAVIYSQIPFYCTGFTDSYKLIFIKYKAVPQGAHFLTGVALAKGFAK